MATDIGLNWFLAISFTLLGVASAVILAYVAFTTPRNSLRVRAVAVTYATLMAALLASTWATDGFRLF